MKTPEEIQKYFEDYPFQPTKRSYGMKGVNDLVLNTATMKSIVQEWVDKNFVGNAIEVADFAKEATSAGFYRVVLKEKENTN